MHDISRRQIIASFSASILYRPAFITAGSGIGLITDPRPAKAWVQVAIAAAAAIAAMIAAHNRGDGGLGSVLGAINAKLTLAIQQLADLQNDVATVLKDLRELSEKFDEALKRDDIRKLQRECRTVLNEYVKMLKVREQYKSDAEWKDKNVDEDLKSLLFRLQAARGNLRTDGAIDPTSALVVSSVAFLEHSLMVLRGYRPVDIRVALQTEYLPWFNDIANPALAISAQSYANAAAERHSKYMKDAAEHPLGKKLGMKVDTPTIGACAGINNFTPAIYYERCEFKSSSIRDEASIKAAARNILGDDATEEEINDTASKLAALLSPTGPSSGVDVSSGATSLWAQNTTPRVQDTTARPSEIILAERNCYKSSLKSPEVARERDRIFQQISLINEEIIADGKKSGVLALRLQPGEAQRGLAGEPSVPGDAMCSIEKVSIGTESGRLNRMKSSKIWENLDRDIESFKKILENIQVERTRIAFGIASVGIAETAKSQLADLLEHYK
jgi:hypothetical protein